MQESKEILKMEKEEALKDRLKEIKKKGEFQEIESQIPAGKLKEIVGFKHFKDVAEVFRNLFVTKDIEIEKGKKKISFRDLLPKSVRYFVRDKYNGFTKKDEMFELVPVKDEETLETKMEIIIYGDLSEKGGVLSLLHEIGHTHSDRLLEMNLGKIRKKLEKEYDQAVEEGRRKPRKGEMLFRISKEEEFRPVSRQLLERFLELKAREERDAWAYALRKLREFREKGIDLEPEMKKLKDIESFIYSEIGLGGYVEEFEEKTKAREEMPFITKIFTK